MMDIDKAMRQVQGAASDDIMYISVASILGI